MKLEKKPHYEDADENTDYVERIPKLRRHQLLLDAEKLRLKQELEHARAMREKL